MPIYQSMGQLSVAASVALSNATILAGSITNTAMNVLRRHPYLDRPLIDFDLFVLMQPSTSVGRCSSGCDFGGLSGQGAGLQPGLPAAQQPSIVALQ